MDDSQLERRVIRIEDYSPAIAFVFWVLGCLVVVGILLTQVQMDSFAQKAGLGITVAVTLWVLLTDRGLVVDLDQVRQTVVRHRIGLWGTKYDDEVQEIPFREIACVELKRTSQGFGRGSYDDYRVRLRVKGSESVDVTKPVMSLVAASNKAVSISAAIGLEQAPTPVD